MGARGRASSGEFAEPQGRLTLAVCDLPVKGLPRAGTAPSLTWGCVWVRNRGVGLSGLRGVLRAGPAYLQLHCSSAPQRLNLGEGRKERGREGRKPFGFLWRGARGRRVQERPARPSYASCPGWACGHTGSLWPARIPRPQMGVWQGGPTLGQLQPLWDASCLHRRGGCTTGSGECRQLCPPSTQAVALVGPGLRGGGLSAAEPRAAGSLPWPAGAGETETRGEGQEQQTGQATLAPGQKFYC